MRAYWIKIVLGALGVFAVGMVAINVVRIGGRKITSTLESTDPIPLPIAFVSFKLNGAKLGTIDKIVLLRDDPKHISSVRVVVDGVSDSLFEGSFGSCSLAIDDVERINEKSSFRCLGAETPIPGGLVPFGFVAFKDREDSLPLLLPARTVEKLRQTTFNIGADGINIESEDDSLQAEAESRADSIEAATEQLGDSLSHVADSLVEAGNRRADSIRQHPPQVRSKHSHQP